VYPVLEMSTEGRGGTTFRIVAGDPWTPSLWPSEMFRTVDGRLPSNWVVDVGDGGRMKIGPAAWMARGFWEAYFDREPDAVARYEGELPCLLAELQEE
jgi:hypothetical protein